MDLHGNPITETKVDEFRAALPGCQIEFYTAITIGGIEYSTSLTELRVSYYDRHVITQNEAKDSYLGHLKYMTNLRSLKLDLNIDWSDEFIDINELSMLRDLESLKLTGIRIGNIGALRGLTNLRELSLWNTGINDLTAIVGLTNLVRTYEFGEVESVG